MKTESWPLFGPSTISNGKQTPGTRHDEQAPVGIPFLFPSPVSYLSAPKAALRTGWGRLVLWVPARAFHRPPNPPVLLALWVWARFRQHRRHPGCSALHGQVWHSAPPHTHTVPTPAFYPTEWRREKWLHRLRTLKPIKQGYVPSPLQYWKPRAPVFWWW